MSFLKKLTSYFLNYDSSDDEEKMADRPYDNGLDLHLSQLSQDKQIAYLENGKVSFKPTKPTPINFITTHIIFNVCRCFDENDKPISNVTANDLVKIEYKYRRNDRAEKFYLTGKLKSILPGYEGNKPGVDNHLKPVETFFKSVIYIVNNLQCKIWWDGFQVQLDKNPFYRFQILKLDMEPFRIIINVRNLRKLHVHRSNKSIRLDGMDTNHVQKLLEIRGERAAAVKITLPRNGTLQFDFPAYLEVGHKF